MLSNLILSFPIVMLESQMSDSESCASSTSSSMMISSSSEESSANLSPGSIGSCSSTSSNCSFSSTTSVSGKITKDQGSPYPPEIHREMVEWPNFQNGFAVYTFMGKLIKYYTFFVIALWD